MKLITLIAGTFLFLTAHQSVGQEAGQRTSPPMPIGGGLICDTLEQANHAIENPGSSTEGCGILRGQRMATVTLLEVKIHNGLAFQMARYDFLGDPGFNAVQFGFWGQPQRTQASVEIEA